MDITIKFKPSTNEEVAYTINAPLETIGETLDNMDMISRTLPSVLRDLADHYEHLFFEKHNGNYEGFSENYISSSITCEAMPEESILSEDEFYDEMAERETYEYVDWYAGL